MLDVVEVDNKLYDPYHILGVTKDDDDKTILDAFRKRVRKYHPDKVQDPEKKTKYGTYFRILLMSLKYIQNKRSLCSRKVTKGHCTPMVESRGDDEKDTHKYDEHGYGDYDRYSNVKDYKNDTINIVNPFGRKKYSPKKFHRLFEYIKANHERDENADNSVALIHRSTDGFYGHNAGDLGNCALVSSFNGLMITSDHLGKEGIGYYGANYSDYKQSYDKAPNPDKTINIPSNFSYSHKKQNTAGCTNVPLWEHQDDQDNPNEQINLSKETENLHKRAVKMLKEQAEKDKQRVLEYQHMYDRSTFQQALDGELETSPSLLDHVDNHYKRINFQ
jgi:DnaJ domain